MKAKRKRLDIEGLTLEEHAVLAEEIRRFRRALLFSERSPWRLSRTKAAREPLRALDRLLDGLKNDLDSIFCNAFPDQHVYVTSPYFGEGKTVAEAKQGRRPAQLLTGLGPGPFFSEKEERPNDR
jgi:hypothetical protein